MMQPENRTTSEAPRPPIASILGILIVIPLFLSLSGCASTKIEPGRVMAPLDNLPKPPVMLIYNFAVDADKVIVDTSGPSLVSGDGDPSERLETGREVQSSFSKALVAKLNEKGIHARRAKRDTQPELHSLIIKGQFLIIDEGDAMARTVVGFGRGSTELRIAVQTYQATESGLKQLVVGEGTSEGSKKPGMLIPVAGGAVLGNAARSAVVSGGISIVSEATGKLKADINRLVDELAERAVQFYIDRGWL